MPSINMISFIDGIASEPDRLPITSVLLRKIFETFEINHRFLDGLLRQRMPGRSIYHTVQPQKHLRHGQGLGPNLA